MKIVTLETNKPMQVYSYSILSLLGYVVHFNATSYAFRKDANLEDYELYDYTKIHSIYDAHVTQWKTYI